MARKQLGAAIAAAKDAVTKAYADSQPGIVGATGASGASGAQGASGAPGASGASGASGAPGASGVPAITGVVNRGMYYSLSLSDAGKCIYGNPGGSVTIPANSSVAFPVGTQIIVINTGAGNMTVEITTDTLQWRNSGGITSGNMTLGTGKSITLIKLTTTSWWAIHHYQSF